MGNIVSWWQSVRTGRQQRMLSGVEARLGNGEEIQHIVWGTVAPEMRRPAILALTNQRIIRYTRTITGEDVISLPLHQITLIDELSGIGWYRVDMHFQNGRLSFYVGRNEKQSLKALVEHVRQGQGGGPKLLSPDVEEVKGGVTRLPVNPTPRVVASSEENVPITEQIRALARLQEDGIISKREFEQKKRELLKRL